MSPLYIAYIYFTEQNETIFNQMNNQKNIQNFKNLLFHLYYNFILYMISTDKY